MCVVIYLWCENVANLNHKAVFGVNVRHFLKKIQRIVFNNRAMVRVFVKEGIIIVYTWNSSPIDETYIICSTPAIRRKVIFILDIELQGEITFAFNNTNFTSENLRLATADFSHVVP